MDEKEKEQCIKDLDQVIILSLSDEELEGYSEFLALAIDGKGLNDYE